MTEPFLEACPVCGAPGATELVRFPELAFGTCAGCGLIYKRAQRPGLGAGYDADYFAHGSARYTRRWAHRVRKCARQLLAAQEYAPAAGTVLDVGCSVGYVLEAGRRLGLAPTGVDPAAFAVEACRDRGLAAEVGTLETLPFDEGRFDLVTAKHTLEHLADPLAGLREIRRVLSPGGVALLVVPDADYWKRFLMPRRGGFFRPDRAGWQHHVYFTDRHLADACRRAGLTPVKAGKAVFRRRLARGPRWLYEAARWGVVAAWNGTARRLHLRREIQLIARRPPGGRGAA